MLQNMTWNLPTDFSISIKKFEFNYDNEQSAYGYISIYPNNGKWFSDTAVEELLHATLALHQPMTIKASNGSPIIRVTFHEYSK